MSFDKQNFARTIQEQQAGISPQMWPIKIDPGTLSLNSPFEIEINPCDHIWLPITYDKSYGVLPLQNFVTPPWGAGPAIVGWNTIDVIDTDGPASGGMAPLYGTNAPVFALRFNTPNNPWLLWGLSTLQTAWRYGPTAGDSWAPAGASTMMRSITGPISRLWCQYYRWAKYHGEDTTSQVMLLSMLGFNHQSSEHVQAQIDGGTNGPRPDPESVTMIGGGGYRTPDLNSADLRVLGQNPVAVAPTPAGAGSTKG